MSVFVLSRIRILLRTTTTVSLLLAGTGFVSCANDHNSNTKDIFREDIGDAKLGNARRHPATSEEKLWTINMNGCTGHLISPDYMMSANHCSPRAGARYKSGYADAKGLSADIIVSQVIESGADLDYAIMKIRWTNGYPRNQNFPPLIATKSTDLKFGRDLNSGDELFTVGYPQDKFNSWGATYAEGRAKVSQGNRLFYDIGIINGNSGGGVWRKSDKMLVSLTNGGSRAFGQAGWDSSSIATGTNWNFGPPIWVVYGRSKILQDIFPGGRNRYATAPQPTDTDIAVFIGKADNSGADIYTLYFAAPETSANLYFCSNSTASNCSDAADGYTIAEKIKTKDGRSYFQGKSTTALNDGIKLTIIASDASNKKVASKTVKFDVK